MTLTRGLTVDTSFEDWVKQSQFGQMSSARKGGAIIVFDYEGNPIKRYVLTNAWPKSLEIGSLKAGDTSVLTEKLVITYEVMEASALGCVAPSARSSARTARPEADLLRTTFEFELPRGYVDAAAPSTVWGRFVWRPQGTSRAPGRQSGARTTPPTSRSSCWVGWSSGSGR